mgnify:CR=1 FL=1
MKKSILIIAAAVMVSAVSCMKQQIQSYYDNQESNIEKFVDAAKGIRTVHNGGSTRVVMVEGDSADSLASNGIVSFYYAGYVMTGSSVSTSNLFATNFQDFATSSNWNITDTTGFVVETVKLDEEDLLPGLKNGLKGVRGGEECYILFTGKYGYGSHESGTIPAKSTLAYHIWVESISNE